MSPFKTLRFALVPTALVLLASACAETSPDLGGGLGRGDDDVVSKEDTKKKDAPAKKKEPTETPAPAGNTPPPATPQQDQAPTLATISPDAITVGQSPNGVELTLTGTRFAAGSQVDLGGLKVPAQFVSPEQIKVQVPADKVKQVGALRVAVIAKVGLESNALSFTVANPTTVTINSLSPSNVVLGLQNQDVTLNLTGSGYTQQSMVRFNGAALQTTFVSATALRATIPAISFIATGKFAVTVSTGDNVVSLPSPFEVRNPSPAANAVTPSSLTAGDGATVVTISGSRFTKASEVIAGNAALATAFISSTQLRATIPSYLLTKTGTLGLVVSTGAPGGGTSTTLAVTVRAGQTTSTGAQCAYKCADYGFKAFTCYSNWYCIGTGANAGCLAQTSCTDTVTDTGNPNENTSNNASCQYKCTTYNYAPGECTDGFYCRYSDGCLVADSTCNGNGSAGGGGGGGGNQCTYACSTYGYVKGECSGGYYCQYADGCLVKDDTCKDVGGGASGGGGGSSCQYDCAAYGYKSGDCSGGYYCQYSDNCLVRDNTCDD